MSVVVAVHIEVADEGIVWWAESNGIPGWTAAAPTLRDLRVLVDEALADLVDASEAVRLELVADPPPPPPARAEDLPGGVPSIEPSTIGESWRSRTVEVLIPA